MPEPKFLTDNIPHKYILLPNEKHSKTVKSEGLHDNQNWSLEECMHKKTKDQYISICYNLKDTNYAVVDIDTDDYSIDQLIDDTAIDSMWVKGNTKGFHVWVEFPNGKPEQFRKNIVKCSKICEMDYLGEKVFERVGKTWTGEEPCHLHQESIEKCLLWKSSHQKQKRQKIQLHNRQVTKSCLNKWWI